MTDIKHTAGERRAIDAAMSHIRALVEQNFRDENRLKACRKAERKERSSQLVADVSCIGWFLDGVQNPAMPIGELAPEHDECIFMTLLGARYFTKCDHKILVAANKAHATARRRWIETLREERAA